MSVGLYKCYETKQIFTLKMSKDYLKIQNEKKN